MKGIDWTVWRLSSKLVQMPDMLRRLHACHSDDSSARCTYGERNICRLDFKVRQQVSQGALHTIPGRRMLGPTLKRQYLVSILVGSTGWTA